MGKKRKVIGFYTDEEKRRRPITMPFKRKIRKVIRKLRKIRRGLFKPVKYKYLADIVTFKSIKAAKEASRKLLEEFSNAKTRAKKVRVKKATVYAANRAEAFAKKRNLSPRVRKRMLRISEIYRKAAEKMILPPKE